MSQCETWNGFPPPFSPSFLPSFTLERQSAEELGLSLDHPESLFGLSLTHSPSIPREASSSFSGVVLGANYGQLAAPESRVKGHSSV